MGGKRASAGPYHILYAYGNRLSPLSRAIKLLMRLRLLLRFYDVTRMKVRSTLLLGRHNGSRYQALNPFVVFFIMITAILFDDHDWMSEQIGFSNSNRSARICAKTVSLLHGTSHSICGRFCAVLQQEQLRIEREKAVMKNATQMHSLPPDTGKLQK